MNQQSKADDDNRRRDRTREAQGGDGARACASGAWEVLKRRITEQDGTNTGHVEDQPLAHEPPPAEFP
jgi:hypothetical protein